MSMVGDGLPQPQRSLAVAAVLSAMALVVLDASVANVALPTIGKALGVSPARAILVVTAYQTSLAMALLPCGALGERFGHRRVFVLGVLLFTAASACCALAPSLAWLVAARLMQGLGGAAVMALGVALLRFTVPAGQLGAAIGWNALNVALCSAVGPAAGALILTLGSWPWLFIVNLPVGFVALLASRALPFSPKSARPLDLVSMGLSAGIFASLVLAAELLPHAAGAAAALLLVAALSAWALTVREGPKAAPLFPLDLLRTRTIRVSVIASVCCFAGQTAGLVVLPFYLQRDVGLTPMASGLFLVVWPLAVAATATVVGGLSDRVSTGLLCVVGATLLAAGLGAMATLPATVHPLALALLAGVCGLGFGVFQTPNNRNMFLSAPANRSGAAGGMQGSARLSGQIAGAILVTLLFAMGSMQTAPKIALGLGSALALVAALVSASRVRTA